MFYRIIDDTKYPGRWYLDTPSIQGYDDFNLSSLVSFIPKLTDAAWYIDIFHPGEPLDFSFSGFDIPIVNQKTSKLFLSHFKDDIEIIPIKVTGWDNAAFILIAKNIVDCIDENKSEFRRWPSSDREPDKIGQYRMFTNLRIDPSKVNQNVHVFRLSGWEVALACSDMVRNLLEQNDVTGIKFESIT
jgi:hypothetical protein